MREARTIPPPWNLKLVEGPVLGTAAAADARGPRRRPRLPRAPLGAAASGRPARAGHPRLPPAQPPARPPPAALGGAPDRGPRGKPLRDLHEDAPLADRRRQRDAADPARALHRSRRARHARVLDGRRRQSARARARTATAARCGALARAPAAAPMRCDGPRPRRGRARPGRRRRQRPPGALPGARLGARRHARRPAALRHPAVRAAADQGAGEGGRLHAERRGPLSLRHRACAAT